MSAKKTAKKTARKKPVFKKLVLPREEFPQEKSPAEQFDEPINDISLEDSLRDRCNKLDAELDEVTNPFIQIKRKQNELTIVDSDIEHIDNSIENLESARNTAVALKSKILTQIEGLRKMVIAEIN